MCAAAVCLCVLCVCESVTRSMKDTLHRCTLFAAHKILYSLIIMTASVLCNVHCAPWSMEMDMGEGEGKR